MIRLLMVDDEPCFLDLAKIFLNETGDFSVDTAGSVHEALDRLRALSYDALVSDYEMPEMTGITLLKMVRSRNPDLPFILFTGKGREEVVIEALNSGADFYIQKGGDPIAQFTELSHKVRQAVKRRQMERALRRSEKNYRELVDNIPEMLFKTDLNGNIVFINRKGLETLDTSLKDVCGKAWYSHLHPGEREKAQGLIPRMIASGEPVMNYEGGIVTQSGEGRIFPVILNITLLRDDSGTISGAQGIAIDISWQKQADTALLEAEAKYRQISEGIFDGVAIGDRDEIITYASPSMRRITGFACEEMVGHPFLDFVAEPDHQRIKSQFLAVMEGETIEGIKFMLKRKDGSLLSIEMNGGPIIQDGVVIGAQSIIRDVTRQMRIEKALRESEERLRVTLHSIGDGVIVTDRDGRVTLINTVAGKLTGWHDEAVGMPLTDVFHIVNEKTLQPVENPVRRVIEEGVFADLANNTVLIARDGTQRAIADSAAPIRDREGAIIGVVLVFRDVTKERETEKVRRRLAAIVESSDDAIYGTTLEGFITSWNLGAERIYGYPASEALGRHVSAFALPEQHEEFMNIIKQITRSGYMDHFETVRVKRDGTPTLLSITVSPVMDDDGKIAGFSAISRDIGRQKRAEQALDESRQWLEHVVEGVKMGTWEWEARTGKVTFNQHLAVMLGYPSCCREVDAEMIRQLVSEKDFNAVKEAFIATLKGISPIFVTEVHLTVADGRMVLFQARGTVMERDEAGSPLRMSGICQDISEIRGYQEALKKANKKLNLLNGITRHDIRNQTTALQGYLALVQRDGGEKSAATERYLSACTMLVDKIQRQIAFTRDYEDLGVNAPCWQHVGEVAGKVAADLSLKTTGVSLLVDTGDLEVYADPMLEQVLFNLLDNALRHGNGVTEIEMSFQERDHRGVLTVRDNGAGITADLKTRIFQAGYGRNTGYGLFLVKEILDITGIAIHENGEEGKGARFEMLIPPDGYRFG